MNASNEPENDHVLLGAYILGGLSANERLEFELHLEGCAECREELHRASDLPTLMGTLKPAEATALLRASPPVGSVGQEPAGEPEDSADYVDLLDRMAAKRRAGRIRMGALGLAAVAASVTAGVFLAPVIRTGPTPDASYAVATEVGPQVQVGMNAKAWGTELEFNGADLPTSGVLSLWVIDHGGTADRAGSWQATTTGKTKLTGAVPTPMGNIAAVQLRDKDSKVLAVVTLPEGPAAQG